MHFKLILVYQHHEKYLLHNKKNDNNDGTNRVTAISNLASISDQEIANYIVDRLAPPEVSALLQSFDKLKRELKKDYPKGLSKDEFVQFIKLKVATPGYNIANVIEQPLYEPLEKIQQRENEILRGIKIEKENKKIETTRAIQKAIYNREFNKVFKVKSETKKMVDDVNK